MGPDEKRKSDVLRFDQVRVKTLLEDVMLLAEYGLEKGQTLPESINVPELLRLQDYKEHVETVPEKALESLASYYETLTLKFAPVTADTLRATRNIRKSYHETPGGKHLLGLWYLTGGLVLFILAINILRFSFASSELVPGEEATFGMYAYGLQLLATTYLIPFSYGALGSCAYLLRITEKHLKGRTFDPIRTPEHRNRLVLGTLSGGVIVLFIRQIPDVQGGAIELAPAALGFLAGYSIDFLFATLDRIINAILPKVGIDTVARRLDREKLNMLITKYEKMAKDSKLNKKQREDAERFANELKA